VRVMADVSDYDDAVRRIVGEDVPDDAATETDVRRALSGSDSPQVTREVAANLAEGIVTEDQVIEALEGSGELPTEGEIESTAGAVDEHGLDDRVDSVAESAKSTIATVEDVRVSVEAEVEGADGQPFKEDVETGVDRVARDREFVGADADSVAEDEARRVGAPAESDYRGEAAQTVAQGEQVARADVIEDSTSTSSTVSVIRDEGGSPVAAVGDPETGQVVAEQRGVEHLTTQEAVDSMETTGSGDSVDLRLRGSKVGEVDI